MSARVSRFHPGFRGFELTWAVSGQVSHELSGVAGSSGGGAGGSSSGGSRSGTVAVALSSGGRDEAKASSDVGVLHLD